MKKEKGITLIALIITIVVMLILVAVTIRILIDSGLIGKARQAGEDTKTRYAEESRLGENITIDGTVYNSIDDYIGTESVTNKSDLEKLNEFFSNGLDVVWDETNNKYVHGLAPIADADESITNKNVWNNYNIATKRN